MKRTAAKTLIDKNFQALGTINYLKINACADEKISELIIKRVLEIDDRMSVFKAYSDVSKINHCAGRDFVVVHNDTFMLLKRATELSDITGGAFDITIRPLTELWGIGTKGNFVPSPEDISEQKKLVNYKKLLLADKNHCASLQNLGQSVDLGGIAKGYATDEAKRILVDNGVENALINFGGNIMTLGTNPDGQPWEIGIQNPLAPTGVYLGSLSVKNKTVVTSGSNEQFFVKNGVRYHHIIDPRTGSPAQSTLLSVTVVCSSSTDADALTTALFVLGAENSVGLLKLFNADAIFITNDLNVYVTERLIGTFNMTSY